MKRETTITNEIAALERKMNESDNATLKKALKSKIDRLNAEMKGFSMTAKQLALILLKQREKIKALAKKDFNDLIRQLSKKPEYAFLKRYTRTEIQDDMSRRAKPVGFRFKGRGNYDVPTKREIIKGKKDGTVYVERRAKRSDVSLAVQLAQGGTISINELSSGMSQGRKQIQNVQDVIRKHYDVQLENGNVYAAISPIKGNSLKKGDIVLGNYNKYNQGADIYEIIGISEDAKNQDTPVYNSVKDCMKANNVTSLPKLEEAETKEKRFYLIVKDLDTNDQGGWFYLYEGRWARGSGAEPLSFTLMEKVEKTNEPSEESISTQKVYDLYEKYFDKDDDGIEFEVVHTESEDLFFFKNVSKNDPFIIELTDVLKSDTKSAVYQSPVNKTTMIVKILKTPVEVEKIESTPTQKVPKRIDKVKSGDIATDYAGEEWTVIDAVASGYDLNSLEEYDLSGAVDEMKESDDYLDLSYVALKNKLGNTAVFVYGIEGAMVYEDVSIEETKTPTIVKPEIETGAASMNINLFEGVITVTHAQDKSILYQIHDAEIGAWNKIWDAIKSIKGDIVKR